MDALTISAASGLRARMESLDMLANNLSNASTGGYKTDREFYSLYVSPEAAAGTSLPATLPVIERHLTDFSSGALRVTGNPLDVALNGRGFLAVEGHSGPLYTRNGSLRVAPDGTVQAGEGFPVRLVGGGTLRVQSPAALEIATDGTVRQEGQALGKLEVVDFPDPGLLAKQGNTYFRPADATVRPVAAAATELQQGKLEESNVGTPESAVRLVSLMRQFEMLQKAVSLSGEMNRRAVEEVARTGS
jgi:flagellar basal-body rod protein FlgF